MTARCISCGRLPSEGCCDVCHRVARAVARIADAVGYPDTAREMRELYKDGGTLPNLHTRAQQMAGDPIALGTEINTEEANQ